MIITTIKHFIYDTAISQLFSNIFRNFPSKKIKIVDANNLRIGDYISFTINGGSRNYTVVGMVTSISDDNEVILYTKFDDYPLSLLIKDDVVVRVVGAGASNLNDYINH